MQVLIPILSISRPSLLKLKSPSFSHIPPQKIYISLDNKNDNRPVSAGYIYSN
jgi:hypothetical protein